MRYVTDTVEMEILGNRSICDTKKSRYVKDRKRDIMKESNMWQKEIETLGKRAICDIKKSGYVTDRKRDIMKESHMWQKEREQYVT